jgi:hypothetical protein
LRIRSNWYWTELRGHGGQPTSLSWRFFHGRAPTLEDRTRSTRPKPFRSFLKDTPIRHSPYRQGTRDGRDVIDPFPHPGRPTSVRGPQNASPKHQIAYLIPVGRDGPYRPQMGLHIRASVAALVGGGRPSLKNSKLEGSWNVPWAARPQVTLGSTAEHRRTVYATFTIRHVDLLRTHALPQPVSSNPPYR